MSLRTVATRLIHNGRLLLRILRPPKVLEGFNNKILPTGVEVGLESVSSRNTPNRGLTTVGWQLQNWHSHARRIFVDSVLSRVTNSLAGNLRRRAANSLFIGDSAPFFALVGVSLASGAGILTKDDELEGVCWEIRQAISKLRFPTTRDEHEVENKCESNESVNLNNLVLGPPIAKGCSAVVYAARWKGECETEEELCHASTNENVTNEINATTAREKDSEVVEFPLAVKMMFNYDAESNAMSILRAMYRETVPARVQYTPEGLAIWEQGLADRRKGLSPHFNIVAMYYVFADQVPRLPGSFSMYPDALPARINPDGLGRNMSLFLLMKRYSCSLKQYLQEQTPSVRVSILMLAQLLEAVTHMNMQGIAHRDLKSDNILLDFSEGDDTCPLLVVTDFGCCLADRVHGLSLPYNSYDTEKGGNSALMAPEVAVAQPGPFTSINYSKSDPWAVGAIAYELFGRENPFYQLKDSKLQLRNTTYKEEELPELPEGVPSTVTRLVHGLLSRNPAKRLTAESAATVCQLLLWGPSSWVSSTEAVIPSSNEILQWLLCLTTKLLCEGRRGSVPMNTDGCGITGGGRRTLPEYQLIAAFLGRVKLRQVKSALHWIHGF